MKKIEAAKKVDKTLGKAIRETTLESPPVNFSDRTMLKIREVEMIQSAKGVTALGKKFKVTVGIIFCLLATMMLAPLLPPIEPAKEFNTHGEAINGLLLERVFPALTHEIFTPQVMLYLLAVSLGILLLVALEFLLKKRLIRIRS